MNEVCNIMFMQFSFINPFCEKYIFHTLTVESSFL